MKDFNDGGNAGAGFSDPAKAMEMIGLIAGGCAGKSEGQILQAVLAQAEKGKREGTLTNSDLDAFYALVAPTLDASKKTKLQKIIARLKGI